MSGKIRPKDIDIFKEISSIGSGNAATSLSQILKKKVIIEVPEVNLYKLEEAVELFGGAEKSVITVYYDLFGDGIGSIIFMLEKKEAKKLTELLITDLKIKQGELDEMNSSILKETSTILTGSFLIALSKLLKMSFLVSSPVIAEDMSGAIVDRILIETSKEADFILIATTVFIVVDEKIKTFFIFMPNKITMEKIIKKIEN